MARTGSKIIIFLLATAVLSAIALSVLLRSNQFKEWLLTEISLRSGFSVRAESIAFALPLVLIANHVQVSDPGQFHLGAVRLRASVNPWSRSVRQLIIDQPRLSVDIDAIHWSSNRRSTPAGLHDLAVQNGSVIVKRGERMLFEIEKINLRARDLNLGADSGLKLAADVPQLNGVADIRVAGHPRELDAEVIVRAKPSAAARRSEPLRETMRVALQLRAPDGQPIDVAAKGNFHNLDYAGNQFTGSLDGKARIASDLTLARFTATGFIADFPKNFPSVPIKLNNGTLNLNLAGDYSKTAELLTLDSVQLAAPFGNAVGEGKFTLGGEPTISKARLVFRELPFALVGANLPAPFHQWSYDGLSRLNIEAHGPWRSPVIKGSLESNSVRLSGGGVAAASVAVNAPFEWTDHSLRLRELKLIAARVAYAPNAGWQSGAEKLQLVSLLDYQAGESTKISGRLEISGGKFNSPNNTEIGENLRLTGPFEFTAHSARKTTTAAGKFTIEAGELLWGKFFADLKNQRPILDVDMDYLHGEERLDCRRCNLHLASVGLIETSGAIERLATAPVLRLRAASKNFSPNGFFEFFLRETFKRQYPVLDKLVFGGRMTFDLQLDGPAEQLHVAGLLTLSGGAVQARSPQRKEWQVGSIALRLPLQIRRGTESKPAAGALPATGTLVLDEIRFAGHNVAPVAITLSMADNALRVHRPISVNLFGGTMIVDKLFWPDLINHPKRVSFAAEAKRLKLDELTETMNWPHFSGSLSGSIPEVQATETLLRTRGEIQAELFGGRIAVSKLEIGDPFSSLASIKFDARVENIEMEQLTKTFAFGRISGILEGTLENLVLIDGQAAELRADFHSVDRGGEQRISVEALDKITVLSSGQNAGALYGGLARLFDSFRYSKLGFKAALKNDRLTLRGVESRGGQEMLVVGSLLPPTVNVVSHTQDIAFSELMRRLERINKSDQPNVK